ncbi:MAG: HD domain-containing phosphohydrolase [Candidatus Acidiferrales bacterium]
MKIEKAFLRSRLARRIFLLFVVCAIAPIAGLAILSFHQVTKQLGEQGRTRLLQANRSQGMAIYERLQFLDTRMRMVATDLSAGGRAIHPPREMSFVAHLEDGFDSLALVTGSGTVRQLFGRISNLPRMPVDAKQFVLSGNTLLTDEKGSDGLPHIFLIRALDPQQPARALLVGEINSKYLANQEVLPVRADVCIFSNSNQAIFCSRQSRLSAYEQIPEKMSGNSGEFDWKAGEQNDLVSYWTLFLKASFFAPAWRVVLIQSSADVMAPMVDFKRTFLLVILVTFWGVALLSLIQIRRSMIPLEMLRTGTLRVASHDFTARVAVSSGDEFEELALSFNTMTSRLGKQFTALATINQIDRDILSLMDTNKIVEKVLTSLKTLLPYDSISVALLDPDNTSQAHSYISSAETQGEISKQSIGLHPDDVNDLLAHPEFLTIQQKNNLPSYLAPLAASGMSSFLVMPLIVKQNLAGTICLGYQASPVLDNEDIVQARQLADQVAIALSNARLIEELAQLHWGTLRALARAIDAKSHWTSGHSERVTQLAVNIGQTMGLSAKELEILHRGGLLHDIGKIGISAAILDKPGKLDTEEYQKMREHVRMGVRILEPIRAFDEIIPIVLHHHEWFNGGGYPDGLVGEAIPLHARIFAVADCYDALASDRPYRRGLQRDQAIEFVTSRAGSQFDPCVVQAFMTVLMREETESNRVAPVQA